MRTTLSDTPAIPSAALLAGILALLLLGLAGVFLPPLLTGALLLALLALALVSARPHWALAFLLLGRSSVDGFKDVLQLFPDAWYGFNLAGLFNILGLVLALFFLARRLARGDRLLPSAPLKWYALLLVVTLVSVPGSAALGASVKLWTRLAGSLGIALLALETARDEARVKLALQITFLAALPPLVVGLYESLTGAGRYFPGYESTSFVFRPDGTFDHPATLGSFLVLVIALGLAALVLNRPILHRPLLILITLAGFTLLVLTYARAEWIGGLAAIGVIGALRYRRLLPAAGIVVLALLLFSPGVRERLFGWNADLTLVWREDVWQASRDILRRPTLFGSGLDTSSLLLHEEIASVSAPPHNDFLRMAIETGVIGATVFCLTMLALSLAGWRAYRRAGRSDDALIGLTLLAVTAGGAIISLGDNYLSYASVQWYIWALVGLAAYQPAADRAVGE